MNINTNGRLIAVGWDNGFILIYDIEEDTPMLLSATRECIGKNLIQFEWPLDGGSSFVALTDDGQIYYFLTTGSERQEDFSEFIPKETVALLPNPPFLSNWFDYRIFSRAKGPQGSIAQR